MNAVSRSGKGKFATSALAMWRQYGLFLPGLTPLLLEMVAPRRHLEGSIHRRCRVRQRHQGSQIVASSWIDMLAGLSP
jgi:hypothetical protein